MTVEYAKNINLLKNDNVLIDTNIWQYIYGIEASEEDYGYSEVVFEHIFGRCGVYTNNQIISEFIHSNMKLAWKRFCHENGYDLRSFDYKRKYQETDDYKSRFEYELNSVQHDILPNVEIIPIDEDIINKSLKMSSRLKDFNDRVIVQCAIEKKAKILTHDADYKMCDSVDVISNNNAYFR